MFCWGHTAAKPAAPQRFWRRYFEGIISAFSKRRAAVPGIYVNWAPSRCVAIWNRLVAADSPYLYCATKAKAELGYTPVISYHEGMRTLVD